MRGRNHDEAGTGPAIGTRGPRGEGSDGARLPAGGTGTAPLTRAAAGRLWAEGGGERLPVSGRSMRPTLEDVAMVRIARHAEARFGDVILFANGELLVVHRVVSLPPGRSFRTKGDGLPHLDLGRVEASDVLGRVIAIEREGRVYRLDRAAGRLYAAVAATASAVEGFFYRFAWRLDAALCSLSGRDRTGPGAVTLLRRAVGGAGRIGLGLTDRLLFRALHPSAPLDGPR